VNKKISKVWTFKSESNPGKTYETLQYDDDTTSCGCPGWTRRVAHDGSRSCRHIRLVDQGLADSQCVSSHSYTEANAPVSNTFSNIQTPLTKPVKLKPATKPAVPQRKIRWQ
jgi:hypothetical protein